MIAEQLFAPPRTKTSKNISFQVVRAVANGHKQYQKSEWIMASASGDTTLTGTRGSGGAGSDRPSGGSENDILHGGGGFGSDQSDIASNPDIIETEITR